MIPKKIHQIFYDFQKGKTIEDYPIFVKCLAENRRFCEEHGYEHVLWENKEIDELISTKFHYYHQLWEDFSQPIQRVDFARYCILFIYGGIYLDLDVKMIQNPEPLLEQSYFFTSWNNDTRQLPYNAVLGAEDNLKLYDDILRHCRESFYEKSQLGIYGSICVSDDRPFHVTKSPQKTQDKTDGSFEDKYKEGPCDIRAQSLL